MAFILRLLRLSQRIMKGLLKIMIYPPIKAIAIASPFLARGAERVLSGQRVTGDQADEGEDAS